MTRPKVGARSATEAALLLAEHHILAVRRGAHGEITDIKHAAFGWISPQEYYLLQKLHDLLPLVGEVVEGGYRFNAMIYGSSFSVRGVTVPTGKILLGSAMVLLGMAIEGQDWQTAVLMLGAILAPFGALILLYIFERALEGAAEDLGAAFAALRNNPYAFGGTPLWIGPTGLPKLNL